MTIGQRVECGGRYVYVWFGDEPLKVGDHVVTEGNWTSDGQPVGWTVTSTEPDEYAGPVKQVLRRVPT